MAKPFSERVREAAESGKDTPTEGFVEYWSGRVDHHEPTRIGSVIVHGHLTIGTPERFYAPELDVAVVSAEEFLSGKERETLLRFYAGSTSGQVQEDFESLLERDSEVLAIGHPTRDEDDQSEWVAGFVGYIEPSDRLVGPEHQEMSTSGFCTEFIERGGEYVVGSPTTDLAEQFAIASKFMYNNADS